MPVCVPGCFAAGDGLTGAEVVAVLGPGGKLVLCAATTPAPGGGQRQRQRAGRHHLSGAFHHHNYLLRQEQVRRGLLVSSPRHHRARRSWDHPVQNTRAPSILDYSLRAAPVVSALKGARASIGLW